MPWTIIGRMSRTVARLRFATHRYIWRSRPDVGQAHLCCSRADFGHAVGLCTVQHALTTGWVQSPACFKTALDNVVWVHFVVGPCAVSFGTSYVGGPNGGQVLQRGQLDNSLVPVPSYACTAKRHVEGADGPPDAKQRSSDGCSSVRLPPWRPSGKSPGYSKPRRDLHLKAEW